MLSKQGRQILRRRLVTDVRVLMSADTYWLRDFGLPVCLAAATALSMDLEALKDQPGQLKRIDAGLGYLIHGLIFEPRLPWDFWEPLWGSLSADPSTWDPVDLGFTIKGRSAPNFKPTKRPL